MSLIDRRSLLRLAGASTLYGAMLGAVRAEGGLLDILGDASNPVPFAHRTPIRIGQAALRVRNLDAMNAFYHEAIGLEVLEKTPEKPVLGAGGVPLLELISRPNAETESPDRAGLYHIAFLMPKRDDLARWLVHAGMTKVQLTGFADHSVSEAIYLNDPEGNGLEVYADRPADRWVWIAGAVTMGTYQLNIDDILSMTDTTRDNYTGAPAGLRIGHMHLKAGAVPTGRDFYQTALGLASTRPDSLDSAFLSSGGYHHHVALSTWNSAGSPQRDPTTTGLDWFSLEVTKPELLDAQGERLKAANINVTEISGGLQTADPWGTTVRLVKA